MDPAETKGSDSSSLEQGLEDDPDSLSVSGRAATSQIKSDDAEQPARGNSFLRSQLSGNEFSASDLVNGPEHLITGAESHQHGPKLFLESVDGERRQLEDEDYARQSNAGFDSDQQDDFASIKTIDDLGFAAWLECAKSPVSSVEQSVATTLSDEEPDAADHDVLTGVGSFATSSPQGPRASLKDVENYLDVEAVGVDLRDSFQISKVGNLRYLPLDKLRNIVNNVVIRRLLRNDCPGISDEELEERTVQVCGHDEPNVTRRKIFSILILIGKVESIMGFVHADICDANLPLQVEWNEKRYYSIKKGGHALSASTSDHFRNWVHLDFENFKNNQACVLAPFFQLGNDQVYFYKLDSSHIVLPYTEYETKNQGGYGRVFKVKIHHAHHSFKSTKNLPEDNPYFAVKEIQSNDSQSYRKEVEVLEKISGVNKGHSHLIRLLLTYRYNSKYYLLFHWANGNLREFWRRHPEPPITLVHVRWLISQCRGIATGLYKIHRATTWPKEVPGTSGGNIKEWGRHGDIKPENILWFIQPNDRLVISDFGLTRYHSSHSRSKVPHDQVPGYSNTYRPPEFDLKTTISQRYDIWTLGCLYLEFLSWFLRGDAATQRTFSQERLDDVDDREYGRELKEDKFFNIYFHEGNSYTARVKDSVKKWINDLHMLPKCSDFFHAFLDMIEHHLLVPEAEDRWNCNQVCNELNMIFDHCRNDDYCIKGNPRENNTVLGTPRQKIGELRGSESRGQSPMPLLVPGRESDASSGMEGSSAKDFDISNEEVTERLPPAESSTQASSVHEHEESLGTHPSVLLSLPTTESDKIKIDRVYSGPDSSGQPDSAQDGKRTEPQAIPLNELAQDSSLPNTDFYEKVLGSPQGSKSEFQVQSKDERSQAPPVMMDLPILRPETGENSIQSSDKSPAGVPEAGNERYDSEPSVEGREPPGKSIGNDASAERPAEVSHDLAERNDISGATAKDPLHDATVELSNNAAAVRPSNQSPIPEEGRLPRHQLPPKNRVKRFWGRLLEEWGRFSCFPHGRK